MADGMVPEEPQEDFDEIKPFEEKILKRVQRDFSDASDFMRDFHKGCVERYELYHHANKYEDLKKVNEFPVPFLQQQVDDAVADICDKLFYKNRPCTLVGVEETDKEDADVKQSLFDWQDYKDGLRAKISMMVRDVCLTGIAPAQIDYVEEYERRVVGEDQMIPLINPMTGMPVVNPGTGEPMPITDPDGQPLTVRQSVTKDVAVYKGPRVKRVDPVNFFITGEKSAVDDEFPLMIRSYRSRHYFNTKPYFINLKKLKDPSNYGDQQQEGIEQDDNVHRKRMHRGLGVDQQTKRQEFEYVEWHGMVDKKTLYEYMGKPLVGPDGVPLVKDKERTRTICGVCNDRVVVRLEETPFDFQKPNVVVGVIRAEEEDIIGTSIADRVISAQKAMDVTMGILLANFKQSVNAGHVINRSMLATTGKIIVNKPGWVLEVNDDVNKAHKRVEQPRVAPDIYAFLEMMAAMGRDASGITKMIGGAGEPATETLGEATLAAQQAQLRLKDYLRSFEDSLVQPMYDMRNQMNMQFLDKDYLYGIVGEGAIQWRHASPEQIRANVDFVCESSTRETNRSILTQQILQFAKIAPLVQAAGFPIRLDKLLADLAAQGFSWSHERIRDIIPSLKLEKMGINIDEMLLAKFVGVAKLPIDLGGMGGVSGNPSGAEPSRAAPKSESQATENLHRSNQTQLARQ